MDPSHPEGAKRLTYLPPGKQRLKSVLPVLILSLLDAILPNRKYYISQISIKYLRKFKSYTNTTNVSVAQGVRKRIHVTFYQLGHRVGMSVFLSVCVFVWAIAKYPLPEVVKSSGQRSRS